MQCDGDYFDDNRTFNMEGPGDDKNDAINEDWNKNVVPCAEPQEFFDVEDKGKTYQTC